MASISVDELYETQIRSRPAGAKLRLVEGIARDVSDEGRRGAERSLLELEGLGERIWEGIDAGECVDELRTEWDHRP